MGTASTNKRSSAGKNVLVFFIVFIILEMLIIFGVGKIFKNPDVTPGIAGYSVYMTQSDLKAKQDDGSYKVEVPEGVLVIASDGIQDAKNKIGSAVLCENMKGYDVKSGVFWLAEVTSEDGVDGVSYVVSNGTKYYTIKSTNIVGITSSYFETAGKVIKFVTSKFGMIVCAVVPLFLMVLIELIIAIATHEPEEYDEDEDEDDEDQPEKTVKLDDFLFGGENESDVIAKHRQEEAERFAQPETQAAKTQPESLPDIDFSKAKAASEPALTDEQKDMYYQKASQLLDGGSAASETTDTAKQEPVRTAPRKRPAQRRTSNRPASARPRSTAAKSGSASLEDLMKMMEEEQNKLRNKIK